MLYAIKRILLCSVLLLFTWFFYGMNYFTVTDVWSIWTDQEIEVVRFEARNDVAGFADPALTIPADGGATIAKDTAFGVGSFTAMDGNTLKIGESYYPAIDFLITKSESDRSPMQRWLMFVPISFKAGWVAIWDAITGKMTFARFMEPIAIPSNPFVWLFAIPLILLVVCYFKSFVANPWRYLDDDFDEERRLIIFPVLLVFSVLAAAACFFSKGNFSQGFAIGDLQAVLSAGFAFFPPGEVVEGLTAPRWIAVCMYWVCKAFWVAFAIDFLRTYLDTKSLSVTIKYMAVILGFCGLFIIAAVALASPLALVLFVIAVILGLLYFFGQVGRVLSDPSHIVYRDYTVTETVDLGFRRMDE